MEQYYKFHRLQCHFINLPMTLDIEKWERGKAKERIFNVFVEAEFSSNLFNYRKVTCNISEICVSLEMSKIVENIGKICNSTKKHQLSKSRMCEINRTCIKKVQTGLQWHGQHHSNWKFRYKGCMYLYFIFIFNCYRKVVKDFL